jgi:MFS family permease
MVPLVLVLYALERFGSPVVAGWVVFAAMAPGMLISPLAGALLDRMGAARAIAADMAASTALVLALGFCSVAGVVGPPLLVVLTGLYSLTAPLGSAGIRTLIPALVPIAALDRANALDTGSFALIEVAGPALGGGLFGLAGSDATMFVIALLYAVACAALLPLARLRTARTGHRGPLREAAAGVRYVFRQPALRGMAVGYSLNQACWGMLSIAVPVFIVRELGAGARADSVVGGVWAIAGVTGLLGALAAGRMRTFGRERAVIAVGMLVTAVAIWPVTALFALPGLIGGMAMVGFFAGPIDVGILTLRQRVTDPAWLGRTLSISMSLNMSGLPIGSAIGGVLADWSLGAAFAVAALVALLSAATCYALIPDQG